MRQILRSRVSIGVMSIVLLSGACAGGDDTSAVIVEPELTTAAPTTTATTAAPTTVTPTTAAPTTEATTTTVATTTTATPTTTAAPATTTTEEISITPGDDNGESGAVLSAAVCSAEPGFAFANVDEFFDTFEVRRGAGSDAETVATMTPLSEGIRAVGNSGGLDYELVGTDDGWVGAVIATDGVPTGVALFMDPDADHFAAYLLGLTLTLHGELGFTEVNEVIELLGTIMTTDEIATTADVGGCSWRLQRAGTDPENDPLIAVTVTPLTSSEGEELVDSLHNLVELTVVEGILTVI